MSSPVGRSVSSVDDYVDIQPPVEEVISRGNNASPQCSASQESRPLSVMSMAQHQEIPHRFSRASIHPMIGAGLSAREAFGPRTNHDRSTNLNNDSPEKSNKDEFEDSSGGLIGLTQQPENKDTLPNAESLMFRDGRRRIDMILVYEEEDFGVMTEAEMIRRERRKVFQENLEKEGLELELEDKEMSFDGKTFFLKIHVPWKALTRYAEVMNLKLPTKVFRFKELVTASIERNIKSMKFLGRGVYKINNQYVFVSVKTSQISSKEGMKYIVARKYPVETIEYSSFSQPVFTTASSNEPFPGRFIALGRDGWENKERGNKEEEPKPSTVTMSLVPGQKPVPEEKPRFPFNFRKVFEHSHNRIAATEPSFFRSIFSKDEDDRFLVKDRELFYTSAQRSQVVWQILLRAKYDDSGKIGIRRLLNDRTYLAVFPLHEGKYDSESSSGYIFDRRLLYLEWARLACWYKKQPLWLVRKYFGDKIGLYYAWLGFYTQMLIAPAIVGFLCFFYGVVTIDTDQNMPSKEICDESRSGNITLCPLCDKACDFIQLKTSCLFSRITYLFDNPATVFFAIFMSFWEECQTSDPPLDIAICNMEVIILSLYTKATTFLELWKRRQAVIVWEWDLQNTEDDEEPRPEFETSVKTFRINPVTREKEPYLPTWSRMWRFFATSSMVMFMVAVVMGAVLGTIIYRISLVTVIYSSNDQFLSKNAKIFTSVTAAIMNLVIIMILTNLYKKLAIQLTNLENPRTQTEYEDSYTFKIFVFQFVNFYSSLIYIAFFKGRFFNYPGDEEARSTPFLRIKTDVCDPAGCLSELCIQLAIIMVGKQFFNNFLEILFPKIRNWWRLRVHRNKTKDLERKYTRWEEDYHLEDAGRLALFEEYLEMVLQYGFVTLFVAAFPLAPLFALINNIGEIRLDAYKMITQARRPLAERVEDIGAWYGILQGITYMAVVSNAFVIGYTSDFIPRMVFKIGYSNTSSLEGYIDSSLSEFSTADYAAEFLDEDPHKIPPTCQYRGYRYSHNSSAEYRYKLSPQYWHVFAARLAFVVVFEHIVFALTGIMAYAIPDIPSEVKTQIQREKLLENEAKYADGLKQHGENQQGDGDPIAFLRDSERGTIGRGWWGRRLSKVSDSLDFNSTRLRKVKSSGVLEEEP